MTGHYAVFPDSDEGEGGEGAEPWSFARPEKAPGAPLRTTPALQGLMAEAEEMLQQTPGRIALQPALAVGYGRFLLQFWVTDGANRYAVKSISQLARHVAEGATYAYGKKLAFAHGWPPLMSAARRCCDGCWPLWKRALPWRTPLGSPAMTKPSCRGLRAADGTAVRICGARASAMPVPAPSAKSARPPRAAPSAPWRFPRSSWRNS